MTNKKTISIEKLNNAFNIVAFSSLKENGEPVTVENVEAESARIERCVEYYYQKDKKCDLDYPEFASNFLQKNFKEIVFGDKYLGFFLDDVSDEEIKKEYYIDEMPILLGGN